MSESQNEVFLVEPQPLRVHLHLHRRAGVLYGAVAVVVFTIVVLGIVSYATSGRWLMALVTCVVGLALSAFLATTAVAVLGPDLYVDSNGITGRMDWRTRVEAGWDRVVVDAAADDTPSQLRLQIDGRSLNLGANAWYGLRRMALLLATDPAAKGAVTPEARAEIATLLGL